MVREDYVLLLSILDDIKNTRNRQEAHDEIRLTGKAIGDTLLKAI